MMKKAVLLRRFIAALLALCILFALSGCAPKAEPVAPSAEITETPEKIQEPEPKPEPEQEPKPEQEPELDPEPEIEIELPEDPAQFFTYFDSRLSEEGLDPAALAAACEAAFRRDGREKDWDALCYAVSAQWDWRHSIRRELEEDNSAYFYDELSGSEKTPYAYDANRAFKAGSIPPKLLEKMYIPGCALVREYLGTLYTEICYDIAADYSGVGALTHTMEDASPCLNWAHPELWQFMQAQYQFDAVPYFESAYADAGEEAVEYGIDGARSASVTDAVCALLGISEDMLFDAYEAHAREVFPDTRTPRESGGKIRVMLIDESPTVPVNGEETYSMLPFVQDRQAGAVMQDRACFLWGTLCKASVEPQCFAAASEEACADVALHFSVYYPSAGAYHYENGSGTCEVFGAQLTLTAVNLETGETISGEFESMPPSSFTVKGTPGVLYYTLAPHMHTTAGSAAFLEALLAWFPDVTAQITALG